MKVTTFEVSKKFRSLGFILGLAAISYLVVFEEIWGTLVILAASLYCDSQYKCPHCRKSIDIRENPEKIEYCPRCGEALEE